MRAPRPPRVPSPLLLAGALAATGALGLAGCKGDSSTPAASGQGQAQQAAGAGSATTVTLLVTADENGYLLPHEVDGAPKGGAAEMLGQWKREEKHCNAGPACATPLTTLALSTGDHWGTGPAISSRFQGEPAAEVMGRMGYVASAFGNHELDYGREQFLANAQKSGMAFLAANLQATGPAEAMKLKPFQLFERNGLKVAVVGLADATGPQRMMSGRYEGLKASGYEEALAQAVPQAWSAGADAVVVVADVCARELEPVVAKHADWKLALVAGGNCKEAYEGKAGDTRLAYPGQRFEQYLRANLSFDKSKPAGQRLTGVDAKVVDVKGASPDAELVQVVAGYKQRADQELGLQIGFTKAAMPTSTPALGQWVTRAWREELETDAAIINKNGLRNGIPGGKLTSADVYGVLPYENSLMIVELTGEQLVAEAQNPNAIVSGLAPAGKGFKDASGKALDPKKKYTVAVADYLYFGGDGFNFEKHDPEPTETGMMWQTPVIEWTKGKNTRESSPLENALKG
jgi:2',3'-cyclic-nucleotide 2'-phosphodiesterase (5'-nucleotidase family)